MLNVHSFEYFSSALFWVVKVHQSLKQSALSLTALLQGRQTGRKPQTGSEASLGREERQGETRGGSGVGGGLGLGEEASFQR